MIIWTIQNETVCRKLERTGVLRADGRRVWQTFREPYQWMTSQMKDRIGPAPSGVTYPVWAWYQWEGVRKRPDMRTQPMKSFREEMPVALITADIPDDRVQLSDFDTWHYVLNNWVLDSGNFMRECPQEEKIKSWGEHLRPDGTVSASGIPVGKAHRPGHRVGDPGGVDPES